MLFIYMEGINEDCICTLNRINLKVLPSNDIQSNDYVAKIEETCILGCVFACKVQGLLRSMMLMKLVVPSLYTMSDCAFLWEDHTNLIQLRDVINYSAMQHKHVYSLSSCVRSSVIN